MRFFNTAGPVNCDDHYCLPPLRRLHSEELLDLIAQKKYFVLYAPRQTGKTSCLLALMKSPENAEKRPCPQFRIKSATRSHAPRGNAASLRVGTPPQDAPRPLPQSGNPGVPTQSVGTST